MNKQVKVIPRRDRVEKWEYYNPILKRQELVKVFFPDGTERFKAFSNFSFAYNIGIYLRNKEYDREETVRRDVHYFSALLRVYDSEKTENGHDLIENLIYRLRDFRENWKEMENLYPELFYWKEGDER